MIKTLRELEQEKAELNRLRSRCCYCKENASPNFFEPYCERAQKSVTIGSKCPLENKKSPERLSSSKE